MANQEDEFAAFMGEMSKLSEEQDRKDTTKEQHPAPVAVTKQGVLSDSTSRGAQVHSPTNAAQVKAATVRRAPQKAHYGAGPSGAPDQRASNMLGAQPYYVEPGVLAYPSANTNDPIQNIMALDMEKRQLSQAARGKQRMTMGKGDRAEASGKTFVRGIAGESWVDPTLGDWPENDFRLFVGDLGSEVNDEMLTGAFETYPSFNKAKVIIEKRTSKSKGFGFVSFSDGNDFARALREMNGKYIGNRPCKLRKSEWKTRNVQGKAAKFGVTNKNGILKNKKRKDKKHLTFF